MSAKPDYTVTVGAVEYSLNDNEGRFDWAGAIPLCPSCQDVLLPHGEEDGKECPTDARRPFECFVVCPSCDWTSDLIEGVN